MPQPMRHRNFRLDDETWFALTRIAEIQDKRTSDIMRDLVRGYVRRNRRLLDNDSKWQERSRG